MRVIAGTAKRLQLKTIEGMDTRPTTDRIKETLFNMIAHALADSSFLDLFAGSGGIGIEALSRGAERAVFVEKNEKAVACIKDNLKHTKLDGAAQVLQMDVLMALSRLQNQGERFDYIFMDPPYNQDLERTVLEYLSESELLEEGGLIIVEASLNTDMNYVDDLGFEIVKEKVYKTNKHIFLEKKENLE